MKQQLRDASDAEQRVLRESEADDGKCWRVVSSASAIAGDAASEQLGASAPAVLALLEPAATARLQALVAAAPTALVPSPATVQFRTTNGDAVRAAIESFGELGLSAVAPPLQNTQFRAVGVPLPSSGSSSAPGPGATTLPDKTKKDKKKKWWTSG